MHIPALRFGRAYESLDQSAVKDFRTGAVRATVSVVNAGLIRKDLAKLANPLAKFSHAELIALCAKAGDIFVKDSGEYAATLAATSGLAPVLVERNIQRIHAALTNMGAILRGLTRGLDLDHPDPYAFYPVTDVLGVVMPSNSPAVNVLWLPAIALKIPVAIKPGKDEPWTPYRLIQSFIAAGVPAEAFGFYPTDHEGANAILTHCGRSLLFGDKSTTLQYSNNPSIQIHGPGYSKVLIGADRIERWRDYLDLLVDCVAANGGRSCLNASAIVVPAHADEIAQALQQRLDALGPDQLAAFVNPQVAAAIHAQVGGDRLRVINGGTYLLPTIVREPTLVNREFLFPYATVVEMPQEQMLAAIGPSLVVTAITGDEAWIAQLKACRHIDRLNIGPISTMKISWDQPHEGNLFDLLYKRRAFERAP
jgi:acyl-CoA reductase-like NAD-dependent aldehyde dehydrogenase